MQNNLLQVLLIESIDIDAQVIQGLIQNSDLLKFRVHRVSSLHDAVEYLATHQVDVALLDLSLPQCRGLDALQRLLSSFPRVPVVVSTRESDEALGVEAISAGAQDFVSKVMLSGDMIVRRLLFAHVRQAKLLGLKDAADYDQLTSLANRRRFVEAFNENRVLADQADQVLALLDVDHFKQLNDQHGHVGGDHALMHLGKLLASELENDHQVFRYGGEEFAILMDQTIEEAQQRLDALLKRIESETFDVESTPLRLTASVGVTKIVPDDTYENAILRCDDALYNAKALGRNRVVVAQRPAEFSSSLDC